MTDIYINIIKKYHCKLEKKKQYFNGRVWRHKNTSKKEGWEGKETSEKEMDNRRIFITSHMATDLSLLLISNIQKGKIVFN